MNRYPLLLLLASSVLAGCAASKSPTAAPTPIPATRAAPPAAKVGGDSDTHGCKASAGYTWCAKENTCVRPWELAQAKGLGLQEAFKKHCE